MYIGELFEAMDFTWVGDDGEIYRSLNGLVKNNNGIYKSSKQQGFIQKHYGWTLPSFTNPAPGQKYGRFQDDPQLLQTAFGIILQPGQRAIGASGTARWSPGARGQRPVVWYFVLDDYGVVAKYKMKFKGDMRAGTHVDPTATVKEWERDSSAAAPAIQQLKQDAQQSQAAQAAAVAAQVPSKHVGNVGDRIKGAQVEIEASFGPYPGSFGDYYVNKLIMPSGEQLVYFGNKMGNKGDKLTIAFTVGKHDQDKKTGQPTTIIKRPKKVAAKPAAPASASEPAEPISTPKEKDYKPLSTVELKALLAKNAAEKKTEGFDDKAPNPDIVKSIQDEKKKKQEQEKKDQERRDRHFKNYKSGNVRANWKKESIDEDDAAWARANMPKECPKCGHTTSFRNNSCAGGQSVRCSRCGHEHAYKPYEKNLVTSESDVERALDEYIISTYVPNRPT